MLIENQSNMLYVATTIDGLCSGHYHSSGAFGLRAYGRVAAVFVVSREEAFPCIHLLSGLCQESCHSCTTRGPFIPPSD